MFFFCNKLLFKKKEKKGKIDKPICPLKNLPIASIPSLGTGILSGYTQTGSVRINPGFIRVKSTFTRHLAYNKLAIIKHVYIIIFFYVYILFAAIRLKILILLTFIPIIKSEFFLECYKCSSVLRTIKFTLV